MTLATTFDAAVMAGLIQTIDDCEATARDAYARMIKGADRDVWGAVAQDADERAEMARERACGLLEAHFGVPAEDLCRRLG